MAHILAFESLLSEQRTIIIDGGLATQLEAQGCDINNPLWSASVIDADPQAIVDAHRAYLDAGAEVIISASYQATDPVFCRKSVELAMTARDAFLRDNPDAARPLIAASVGPWGAVQGDGSEYTGSYRAGADELRKFHRARLRVLDNSGADLLACETIPNHVEAAVLAEVLRDVSLPAWASFCCRDATSLSDGTAIENAVSLFEKHPRVLAVGINCTRPQFAVPLIGRIRAAVPGVPVVVYPNSGEDFDIVRKSWSGTVTTHDWHQAGRDWLSAGALVLGGCCRTGPQHIQALAELRRA